MPSSWRRTSAKTSINSAAAWDGLVFGNATLFFRQLAAIGITVVIATAGTFVAYGVASLVTKGIRVSSKGEDLGLDCSEHDESAYPAFNGMD